MDINATEETRERLARESDRKIDGWGPGRVWLAWGIYFTVLTIVALAALMGT